MSADQAKSEPSEEATEEPVSPMATRRDINLINFITEGRNPRGIPTAKFIVS